MDVPNAEGERAGDGGAPPVGRLAPSPTGRLHLGHARSFLLAWWSIRSRGGTVRLRIEDLDAARAQAELVDLARRDLKWLGLDWDGEPLVQSADPAPYRAALDRLLAQGDAYACTCTRREIQDVASAPHAPNAAGGEGAELRYPGTCRDRFPDVAAAQQAMGRAAGIRLRVPDGTTRFPDLLVGTAAHDVQAEVGDFLLARRDGVFAYQLAVVVDDARQGVTEVLRGDDLLPSAARQILVQRALGLPHPHWIHVPLVLGEDGERMAKRDRSLTLESLRAEGVDPRAVVAWAARSSGMEAPEPLSAAALVAAFELQRVPREPVRFGASELAEVRRWRV